MAIHVGTFTCVDCGTTTTRRIRSDRARVCLDCGIARAANQARELAIGRLNRERARRAQTVEG